MLQTVNDYDKGVFNGDLGWVVDLDMDGGRLTVDYDGTATGYDFGELDELLDAYRCGLIDIDTLETQTKRSRLELEPIQEELAGISTTEAERGQNTGRLTDAGSLLKALREKVQGPLD